MTVSKAHRFCHCPLGFQMSPYLQDLVAFTGQNHVYEDASEQLKKSNGLEISSKQIERVTNAYGQIAESSCSELQETCCPIRKDSFGKDSPREPFGPLEKEKYDKCSHSPLYCMMDGMASRLDKAVFIADGAKWIWSTACCGTGWVDDQYPDSTQILDFFHCKEKLCDFANPPRPKGMPFPGNPLDWHGKGVLSKGILSDWTSHQQ